MAARESLGQTRVLFPPEIHSEIIRWIAVDWSPAKMGSLRLISREFDTWSRPFVFETLYLGSFTAQRRKMSEQIKLLASGKTGANDVVKTLVIDYTGLVDPHGLEVETRVEQQMLKNLHKIFSSFPKLQKIVLCARDRRTHTDQHIAILRSIIKNTRVEELIFRFQKAEAPRILYFTLPVPSFGGHVIDLPPAASITTLRVDCGQWIRPLDSYIGALIANCTRLSRLEVDLTMTCVQLFGPTLGEEGNAVQLSLEHLFMRNSHDSLTEPKIISRHFRRLKTFGFQVSPYRREDVSWSLMAQYKVWPTQLYVKPHVEEGSSTFFQYLEEHPGLESLYFMDSTSSGNGEDPSTMLGLLTALVPRHAGTLKELELFDSPATWTLSWPGHPDAAEMMKNQLGQLSSLCRFAIRIDWSLHIDFCPPTTDMFPSRHQACKNLNNCHRHRNAMSDLLNLCSESFLQLRELVLSTWLGADAEMPQWLPPHRRDSAPATISLTETTNRIAHDFLTSFHVADPERFRFRVVIGNSLYKVSWSEELQRYSYQAIVPATLMV